MKTPSLTSLNRATKAPAWVETNPAVMEEVTQAAVACPEAWVETNPAVMEEVTQAAEARLEAWVEINPAVMEEVTQAAVACLEAWEVTLDRADIAEETLAAEGRQGVWEVTLDLEALEAMEVTQAQAQAHPEVSSHIQCLLLNCTNI